ncbi:hypothetical protein SUGI_0227170 [Cryptomeria japonica]|uniref:protein MKS1 n=1 Tax=Cryptomeria japonica TaxID=3369 RepID=UPI002408AC47|nr:protein MKS1 [Cryptomeria japonica]GLJ14156.1 hypothetical protein SUGI_0227170 [Cryptomeria japonica]
MNSPQEKTARKELQGPRPTPLKVSRESHQVRKPPLPVQYKPPVIIYAHSPKIIHTDAGEFMTLVQRLTGRNASNPNSHKPPPPAAVSSAGVVFEASCSPKADSFRVSNSNLSLISSPEQESEKLFTRDISPASPGSIPSSSFPPFSPNFSLPSPPLLSPNLFQDLPLFAPQLQLDYSDRFFSPGQIFQKQSELLFNPSPSLRSYMNMNMNSSWSASPTGYDLLNDRPSGNMT